MKRFNVCAAMVAALFALACAKHTSRYSRPGDDPHDTDTLYKLLRKSLTDSDPYPTMAAYDCAMTRLTFRIGPDESSRRMRALLDTVYPTFADRRRSEEVDRKMSGHEFGDCGPEFEGQYQPDSTADSARVAKHPKHPPH